MGLATRNSRLSLMKILSVKSINISRVFPYCSQWVCLLHIPSTYSCPRKRIVRSLLITSDKALGELQSGNNKGRGDYEVF